MSQDSPQRKSPLTGAPLRLPGQSLDRELEDQIVDKLLAPMLVGILLVVLALVEWLRWLVPVRPQPWLYTGIALVYGVWAVLRFRRHHWAQLKALRLGRDGERAIGQYLERLRADGADVFHDIQGEGFNLDHVVISPRGIFTVETKTRSKPTANATVTFDGVQLRIAGHAPDRDPVVQAQAQARWLRDTLKESTGRTWQVRPVIVFPGWFVEPSATDNAKKLGIWLLNPRVLPTFIEHEPTTIPPEDVKLASYHLSRLVRASNV